MIGWERRVLLRHYLDEGLTVAEISHEFGISRQMIYRWIRRSAEDVNRGRKSSKFNQDCTICPSCRWTTSDFSVSP